MVNLIES